MKKTLFMSLFSTIFGLFGCNAQSSNQPPEKASFKSVEVEEFAQVIADTSVIRLDVRTPEEYAEGHIEGALNIDVKSNDFEQKALAALPKTKTIALYCRSGNRSKKAANILANKGYKIVELNSGFMGWTSQTKKDKTNTKE